MSLVHFDRIDSVMKKYIGKYFWGGAFELCNKHIFKITKHYYRNNDNFSLIFCLERIVPDHDFPAGDILDFDHPILLFDDYLDKYLVDDVAVELAKQKALAREKEKYEKVIERINNF